MHNECIIQKIKHLILDSENYEYYIHIDKPMITEDLFNEAIKLALLNQEDLPDKITNCVIKKLFFRNLSSYNDELKIIVPKGFYRGLNNGSWFEKYGQNETVQIHLHSTDETLKEFSHPFVFKLTNQIENNMMKQLSSLRMTSFEDRLAENYQMYCDDNLLVAEIINTLLLESSAYSVSVITK